jgi:hypothetical protein
MATAWETMDFAWEVDSHRSLMRQYAPNRPTPKGWDTVARTPANLLNRYPVDVLVIEQSEVSNRIRSTEPDWFRWFKHTPSKNLPRVVLELCSPAALVCMPHHGGRDKGLRKRMLALGYCQRCALVSNTDEGGAVASDRLVTSYTLIRSLPTSDPEVYDPFTEALTFGTTGPPRAMSNLLRPCNVPRTAYHYRCRKRNDRHQTADANPCHLDWAQLSKLNRVFDDSYPTNLLKDLECRLNGGT